MNRTVRCIHESGHSIFGALNGRPPVMVVCDPDREVGGPLPEDSPRMDGAVFEHWTPEDVSECVLLCARTYAGREAVAIAIVKKLLPPTVDPDVGFLGSDGEADEQKIQAAACRAAELWGADPDQIKCEAQAMARDLLVDHWDAVARFAERLESQGVVSAWEIDDILRGA